jgi:hypothetical protein
MKSEKEKWKSIASETKKKKSKNEIHKRKTKQDNWNKSLKKPLYMDKLMNI